LKNVFFSVTIKMMAPLEHDFNAQDGHSDHIARRSIGLFLQTDFSKPFKEA